MVLVSASYRHCVIHMHHVKSPVACIVLLHRVYCSYRLFVLFIWPVVYICTFFPLPTTYFYSRRSIPFKFPCLYVISVPKRVTPPNVVCVLGVVRYVTFLWDLVVLIWSLFFASESRWTCISTTQALLLLTINIKHIILKGSSHFRMSLK